MIHPHTKQFPADKNYILKQVQSDLKENVLATGIRRGIANYLQIHNPLGFRDATIDKIEGYRTDSPHALDEFYWELAAIYRYQNKENQLAFIFDGRSHYEVFTTEWEEAFCNFIDLCSTHPTFLKAFLGATVFYPGERDAVLVANRLVSFVNKKFSLKVYKYRGVVAC